MSIAVIRMQNARAIAAEVGGAAAMGRRMSMERQQMSHIIGRNPQKEIGDKIARRIETTFGRPVGWLDEEHPELTPTLRDAHFVDIPMLDAQQMTGDLKMQNTEPLIEYMRVPKSWLRMAVKTAYSDLRLLTYRSDDMTDPSAPGSIAPESVLLVDTADSAVTQSGVYVLAWGSSTHVRRCSRSPSEGYRLTPDNKLYEAEVVRDLAKAHISVLGRVVVSFGVQRH